MKRIFSLFLLLILCVPRTWSQTDTDAKVAAILSGLPANSPERLSKTMQELAALGKPGLVAIASQLKPPGQGDNTKIEYALGDSATPLPKPATKPGKNWPPKPTPKRWRRYRMPTTKCF